MAKEDDRKLVGVKIRQQVIDDLKDYAEFTHLPMNYCAERLLEYGLSQETDFQNRKQPPGKVSRDSEKAWNAFSEMSKSAVAGKSGDASYRHDRYLYGRKGGK